MTRLAPMRKFFGPTLALALGLVCAVMVASCGGGGGTLSGATAQQLLDALDQMQTDASTGSCSSVASSATNVASQVETRTNIDPKLKAALVEGFRNLATLADQPGGCESATTTTTTTETTTSDTTPTDTTPTETTPTETTPTQTTPTQTTPTQTTTTGTGGTGGGNGGISP
jgi:hypothetical protein